MHNLPFDTTHIDKGDLDSLIEIYATLTSKYEVTVPDEVKIPLNKFDLCHAGGNKHIAGILQLPHSVNPCYLVFVKTHVERSSRGRATEYFNYTVYGCVISSKDFGRLVIRRETFTDRILNLVHPIELNFPDHKRFNHQFFACANDEQKALTTINRDLRNRIMDIKNETLLIEAVDHILMIGNNNELFPDEVIDLAGVVLSIADNC